MTQPTRAASAHFWIVIAVAAICLNGFTALKYRAARDRIVELQTSHDSIAVKAKVLTSERRGLVALLSRIDTEIEPLRGVMVDSSDAKNVVVRSPVVVYTIAPTCPACALNLPFLNRIEAGASGSVVGVSLAPMEETRRYIVENRIAFPVLVGATGGAMDVLPRHATPVMLIFDEQNLAAFFSGVLSTGEQTFVQSAVNQASGPTAVSVASQVKEGTI